MKLDERFCEFLVKTYTGLKEIRGYIAEIGYRNDVSSEIKEAVIKSKNRITEFMDFMNGAFNTNAKDDKELLKLNYFRRK